MRGRIITSDHRIFELPVRARLVYLFATATAGRR